MGKGREVEFIGGYGIGRTMHESPHVPDDGRSGRGTRNSIAIVGVF